MMGLKARWQKRRPLWAWFTSTDRILRKNPELLAQMKATSTPDRGEE